MCFSRDTLLQLSMTLTRSSGAKSLRDPLVSQVLGRWVASSPFARGRWAEATEITNLPSIRNKQMATMKRYASLLFPAPELIRLLMDLNVPKLSFGHVSEITQDKAPNQFNNTPLADQHFRVLLPPSALSIVSIA